jgi:hypothetical protein
MKNSVKMRRTQSNFQKSSLALMSEGNRSLFKYITTYAAVLWPRVKGHWFGLF